MARGRMISKAISLDEKVNSLSDDTARLLFTWLVPHLDCEGRIHGDAITVKSIVFPRRDISAAKVEKYLKELEKNELVFRYSVNGNQYLLMKNFEKHQTGLEKSREAQSQIPPFTPELLPTNSRLTLTQVKVKDKEETKEEVKDKEKTKQKERSVQFLKSIEEVITLYQENVLLGATIPEDMEAELKTACGRYSPDWLYDAIREAIEQNHPDWRYIVGILRHWAKYGRKKR